MTNVGRPIYLDSSALVKLIIREKESAALLAFIADYAAEEQFSCNLARVEVVHAVRRIDPRTLWRARDVLNHTRLIALDAELLDHAGDLQFPLRTLDAIHLAAAVTIRDQLDFMVTYDHRLATASIEAGLRVAAPGA